MSDNKMMCDNCGASEYTIVYEGKIRAGSFGKYTDKRHKVVKCTNCGLVRLNENPIDSVYYKTSEYRNDYNDTGEVGDYLAEHDNEQPARMQAIGMEAFRDKIVIDYGCGGGAFLDLIKGVARKTIGIEPFEGYHKSLRDRGHKVYANAKGAVNDMHEKVDTIVSFGVIEHVESPSQYLSDAIQLLAEDGVMYLETDNLNDILLKISVKEFEPFFYRTAHLWYFDSNTLEQLAHKAGFTRLSISHRHNFDLSNIISWAVDKKPTGCGKLTLFNETLDAVWVDYLERNGYADLVCAVLKK